ncbi:hypothetical protein FIV00_03820 [Labrenzia sp. THAF82]|nr:hypothetical protein FIV00_03180 [Labrenzia sp. THAF82]QFT29597.1 hypothetical protein FIV00_03820 [Labrenzia sp. THAF82]
MNPSISSGNDLVRIGLPDDWLGLVGVVLSDEAFDGFLAINDGMKDAVFELPPAQFGEEAFDGIEP